MSETRATGKRFNPIPPVPAGNLFRLRVVGSIESQSTVNVFGYQDDQPPGSAGQLEMQELAQAFVAANGMMTAYLNAVSIDWTAKRIDVDLPIHPEVAPYQLPLTLANGNGPPDHMPTTVGVTISKQTFWGGQRGRGRITVPGVPDLWVVGSTVTDKSFYTALADKMSAVIIGGGQTFFPCIFGYSPPPALGWHVAGIERCVVRDVLGSARRRKLGVGS